MKSKLKLRYVTSLELRSVEELDSVVVHTNKKQELKNMDNFV